MDLKRGPATVINKSECVHVSGMHSKNGRVVFTTVWLYQFHLRDPCCTNKIIHNNQSSSLWRGVHAFTISSHVL